MDDSFVFRYPLSDSGAASSDGNAVADMMSTLLQQLLGIVVLYGPGGEELDVRDFAFIRGGGRSGVWSSRRHADQG